ncbi:MAG: hypothetical protein HN909_00405 [Phycisphaerales bacterium]|nr:hypothetical protein [Phycisphaerales bacterium]MBT7170212.1 hypothetical protein [Phycisphaerales bacterium]
MLELRIFDTQETNGEDILIPLSDYLSVLDRVFPKYKKGKWEIEKGADGYGLSVVEISDKIYTSNQSEIIEPEILITNLLSGKEYFWHVCIKVIGTGIEGGFKSLT